MYDALRRAKDRHTILCNLLHDYFQTVISHCRSFIERFAMAAMYDKCRNNMMPVTNII